jgi:hypothetical protein
MINDGTQTTENNSLGIEGKENAFNQIIECNYCGTLFSKANKPLILKCTHSICQMCHELNLNYLICLICKAKYTRKENRRHPINFILLEIIEKSLSPEDAFLHANKFNKRFKKRKSPKSSLKSSNTFDKEKSEKLEKQKNKTSPKESSTTYKCETCEILFPNKFHFDKYPDHEYKQVIQKENKLNQLKEKSNELMEKYKQFNADFDKFSAKFFDLVINEFIKNKDNFIEIFKKESDSLMTLLYFGILNKSDKERLSYFKETYLNEKIFNLIKSAKSLDELKHLLVGSEIKVGQFLSSYFFYEEIYKKKLERCEEKFERYEKNINDLEHSDFKEFTRKFCEDLFVMTYETLDLENEISSKYKVLSILTKDYDYITFDPSIERLLVFKNIIIYFPYHLKNLQKFSYVLSNDLLLYITGGLNEDLINQSTFFSIDLKNKSSIEMKNMIESRYNHSSIIIKKNLFVIGGKSKIGEIEYHTKSIEKYNFKEDNWIKLKQCPIEFKNKPNLLNFEDEYLYAFDDLINFAYYLIKDDTWTHCKPTYKNSYHLNLRNFVSIYHKSNVLILGGYNNHQIESEINKKIYFLKDTNSMISHVNEEFKIIDTSSLLDVGYMISIHYLLEYSQKSELIKIHKSENLSTYKWTTLNEIKFEDIKEYN